MNLKTVLEDIFLEHGFPLFGVVIPEQPPSYNRYIDWIKNNFHAGMDYLGSEKGMEARKDPTILMPEVKSIAVIGKPYPVTQKTIPGLNQESGIITDYALQDDYHLTIPVEIKNILDPITKKYSFNYRIFTDAAPILERDLGVSAGLGWIGKNTNLISPQLGSRFFLVEVFLDCFLPETQPFTKDYCGKCRACIEACPTSCILPDRIIDAGKCISYLTIENKGSIPRELRTSIGNRVFGCDTCQDVCPWNKKQQSSKTFLEFTSSINLLEVLKLSPQAFNRKFRKSPVKRAKRRGFLRNAAVALGNSKNKEILDDLFTAYNNEFEPLVREHIAWAIGNIGTEKSISLLNFMLETENDETVKKEILNFLN